MTRRLAAVVLLAVAASGCSYVLRIVFPRVNAKGGYEDKTLDCGLRGCIDEGPGCDTAVVPGQCAFGGDVDAARALCKAHPKCRAIVCRDGQCLARRHFARKEARGHVAYLVKEGSTHPCEYPVWVQIDRPTECASMGHRPTIPTPFTPVQPIDGSCKPACEAISQRCVYIQSTSESQRCDSANATQCFCANPPADVAFGELTVMKAFADGGRTCEAQCRDAWIEGWRGSCTGSWEPATGWTRACDAADMPDRRVVCVCDDPELIEGPPRSTSDPDPCQKLSDEKGMMPGAAGFSTEADRTAWKLYACATEPSAASKTRLCHRMRTELAFAGDALGGDHCNEQATWRELECSNGDPDDIDVVLRPPRKQSYVATLESLTAKDTTELNDDEIFVLEGYDGFDDDAACDGASGDETGFDDDDTHDMCDRESENGVCTSVTYSSSAFFLICEADSGLFGDNDTVGRIKFGAASAMCGEQARTPSQANETNTAGSYEAKVTVTGPPAGRVLPPLAYKRRYRLFVGAATDRCLRVVVPMAARNTWIPIVVGSCDGPEALFQFEAASVSPDAGLVSWYSGAYVQFYEDDDGSLRLGAHVGSQITAGGGLAASVGVSRALVGLASDMVNVNVGNQPDRSFRIKIPENEDTPEGYAVVLPNDEVHANAGEAPVELRAVAYDTLAPDYFATIYRGRNANAEELSSALQASRVFGTCSDGWRTALETTLGCVISAKLSVPGCTGAMTCNAAITNIREGGDRPLASECNLQALKGYTLDPTAALIDALGCAGGAAAPEHAAGQQILENVCTGDSVAGDAMALTVSSAARISTWGVCKAFPETVDALSNAWRNLSDSGKVYYRNDFGADVTLRARSLKASGRYFEVPAGCDTVDSCHVCGWIEGCEWRWDGVESLVPRRGHCRSTSDPAPLAGWPSGEGSLRAWSLVNAPQAGVRYGTCEELSDRGATVTVPSVP